MNLPHFSSQKAINEELLMLHESCIFSCRRHPATPSLYPNKQAIFSFFFFLKVGHSLLADTHGYILQLLFPLFFTLVLLLISDTCVFSLRSMSKIVVAAKGSYQQVLVHDPWDKHDSHKCVAGEFREFISDMRPGERTVVAAVVPLFTHM